MSDHSYDTSDGHYYLKSHHLYGYVSHDSAQDLVALGAYVAQKDPDAIGHHIAISKDNLDSATLFDTPAASALKAARLAALSLTQFTLLNEHSTGYCLLSDQDLAQLLNYESAKEDWRRRATSIEVLACPDRTPRRILGVQAEILTRQAFEQLRKSNPRFGDLQLTSMLVEGQPTRIIKDASGTVLASSAATNDSRQFFASAIKRLIQTVPAHEQSLDEFVANCLVFHVCPHPDPEQTLENETNRSILRGELTRLYRDLYQIGRAPAVPEEDFVANSIDNLVDSGLGPRSIQFGYPHLPNVVRSDLPGGRRAELAAYLRTLHAQACDDHTESTTQRERSTS